jgi:hypothetical protein
VTIAERRRLAIEGSGLSASEYWVRASAPVTLEERAFIDPALGEHIFAVTFDRPRLSAGESARLIVIRRKPRNERRGRSGHKPAKRAPSTYQAHLARQAAQDTAGSDAAPGRQD